jgi:hypothetical protein
MAKAMEEARAIVKAFMADKRMDGPISEIEGVMADHIATALATREAEIERLRGESPGWVPFAGIHGRMACRMPADDSIVEVLMPTGEVIRGRYSCNIMEPGDWDILPVDDGDEAIIDAESLSSALAWRAALSAPKGGQDE